MKRRAILLGMGGALASLAAPAIAQTAKQGRIAILHPGGAGVFADTVGVFRSEMARLGYREGQDLSIEVRWANGKTERLPALAAELIAQKPDVIVTASSGALAAAKKSTSSIPIVFATAQNVVDQGFVASLQRPGGNVTGVSVHGVVLTRKVVELAREMFPAAERLAVLIHEPDPVSKLEQDQFELTARQMKFEPLVVRIARIEDLDRAFRDLARLKPAAVVVPMIAIFGNHRREVFQGGIKAKLALLGADLRYADAGALMSYGTPIEENYRRAAVMVDKILRGAKPAELPVEQPERLQIVLNSKTAKAIGVSFPGVMRLRADRVIE